ncbi:tol-pal system-associated acyl-CoA thioesterase [Halomonas shantousis]
MSTFQHPVTVYIEDTDAGGIVYYVNYLKFMERARSEWLRQFDLTQQQLMETGVQLVVHRLECRYAKPARLDDRLLVSAEVVATSACRMTFRQEVSGHGDVLCEAEVDVACLDAATLRPRRWPDALRPVLNG